MEFPEEEQKLIRQYLLGHLDEEQCQQLEERIFSSPDFKTRVLIAEDELAEDYVAGVLLTRDKEAFRQRHFLTREQNRRFDMISTLSAYAVQQPPISIATTVSVAPARRPRGIKRLAFLISWPVPALLTAAVILAAGFTLWFVRYSWKSSSNTDDLIRRQEIEKEVSRLNPYGSQPLPPELMAPAFHVSSVTLMPNVNRGNGEQAKVKILDNTTVVQFHMKLPLDGYESYRIALYTSKGLELLRHDGLTSQALGGFKDLVFNMPSSGLLPDDYQLRLSGRHGTNQFEDVAEYYFRVAQHNSR